MPGTSKVLSLIGRIGDRLAAADSGHPGVKPLRRKLAETPLPQENPVVAFETAPQQLEEQLESALCAIPRPDLAPIANGIIDARTELRWRVDCGLYYAEGADVGAAYLDGNMHCELIGPTYGVFHAPDFRLGLFLLCPHVLYRDHRHEAPEFYLNLTGPTDWRFDLGPWGTRAAGEMIWNHAGRIHATRVGDSPFLSVYAWTEDVMAQCEVVAANDW